MTSDDTVNGAVEGTKRSSGFRAAHRRQDPIDGPRSLGAKRLALQAQKQRQTVVDWHVGLLRTSGQGTCVLVSANGTVAFAISHTASRLFVEKRHCPLVGRRTSHAMSFEDASTFDRWCDVEPTRFDDPLLSDQLRRRGHELLAARG